MRVSAGRSHGPQRVPAGRSHGRCVYKSLSRSLFLEFHTHPEQRLLFDYNSNTHVQLPLE